MDFTKGLTAPASSQPVAEPVAQPVSEPSTPASEQVSLIDTPAPVNTPAQPQTPNTAQPPAAAPAKTETSQQPDIWGTIDTMSGGLFKDEATFKEALPKLQEYDTLRKAHDELSAQMAKAPKFFDDEVRILNDLKASGASKEQIRTFQKINEYGELSQMSDRDALIAKMVMNGTKPSTAELKVDRDFRFNELEDLDPADKELLEDDIRIAANAAREDLTKLKATAAQVDQVPPEELQLQQQARIQAHQAAVKPYVADVVKSIPHLGQITVIPGKDGSAGVKYELPLDDAQRAQMGRLVEEYFMDGLTLVTEQSTMEALKYARNEIVMDNIEGLFQKFAQETEARITERLANQYENRSGLKQPTESPIIQGQSAEQQTASFMTRLANRGRVAN